MPTVGLVGRRRIDRGLQATPTTSGETTKTTKTTKTTVTDVTFAAASRTPNEISFPREGGVAYDGPTTGDCYASRVEDTHLLKGFALVASAVLYGALVEL